MPRIMRWLYRDLLECYYDREKPLPSDPEDVCDLIGAFDQAERDIVPRILKMKFSLSDEGWRNDRCDEVLSAYLATQVEENERQANEAERQRRHRESRKELFRKLRDDFDIVPPYDTKTSDLRTLLESKTSRTSHNPVTRDEHVTYFEQTTDATAITNNHKPLTINQEPIQKVKTIVTPVGETIDVQDVFSYWQSKRGHERAKLDDKRKKAIKARLKDGYTVGDLCLAVDGVSKSGHHMGQNSQGAVYDDIELICRTAVNVDKFLKLASPQQFTDPGLQRQVEILQDWMEKP